MTRLEQPEFAPRPEGDVMTTQMPRGVPIVQPEDRHLSKATPRDTPFLLDGDLLMVTNDQRTPVTFRWAKKSYTIEAGEERPVPFEALVNALGDPRSADKAVTKFNDGNGNKGLVMTRYDELSRLMAVYSIEGEHLEDWIDRDGTHKDGLLSRTPVVRIKTLAGQKVMFPGQNPDMLPLPAMEIDEHPINTDSTKRTDALAAENEELRDRIEKLESLMQDEVARRSGVDPEAR